jgi:glycosyltransferase involved in cell wall biosynthesis
MQGTERDPDIEECAGYRAPASRLLLGAVPCDKPPLLSIAIPTYRRFDLLAETLESVFRLDFEIPVEVLVVDNDPLNDAMAISQMEKFKGRSLCYYKNQHNLGMFGNWNQCLALARGQYVTILHDDDLLLPEFALQVNRKLGMRNFTGDIFGFRVSILDEREGHSDASPVGFQSARAGLLSALRARLGVETTTVTLNDFFFGNLFCGTLGVVIRRRLALEIGAFDAHWYPIADYEFWCRWLTMVGDISLVKARVGLYRMRQNESLMPDVRRAYVTKSLALRRKLIDEGAVLREFASLLVPLSAMQELMIGHDWRAKSAGPIPVIQRARVLLWRGLTFLVARLAPVGPFKRRPRF